jgi:peptidyl-tRNA hydrolase
MKNDKMFLITRADLAPGQQAVQTAHVLTEFIFEHQYEAARWKNESNTIVMLTVDDEYQLLQLLNQAREQSISNSLFKEPDLQDAVTAIALAPGNATHKLCKTLSLALRK